MDNLSKKTQEMVDDLLRDWEVDSKSEMLECAFVNLEQLWKFAPGLDGHPIYALTIVQFRAALDRINSRAPEA